MENLGLLIEALEFIEKNLASPIRTESISEYLHCSKSTIEKLFKYVNNISIRDYIIRRRMSRASRDLVKNPDRSLLDIGIEYGYGSNEAFTRAFQSVWQVSPSEFRKNPSEFELFPGYRIERELLEDKKMTDRKKVDISELYDCIKERKGCFLILGDIKGLIPINEISRKAGDLAIITSLKRMEQAAGPEDVVFRIGGDEFVILTDSTDEAYAKKLCGEIVSHNDECISWDGNEIPLTLYVKAVRYEGGSALRYSDFFTMLHSEISEEFKRQCYEGK
ncbi:MAG: helix-turn-helix domain-containing protein [Clostridiales bacterium]|nr:helix-turn-helix domain-containing protein [Clostridiales bacterium]